jgi:putative ABC transport system substrate-binding protein
MRRREFITLLSGVAVGWPLAARAERAPFLVGLIGNAPYWPHFREAMHDLGYREGQNVKYELRTGETEPARLAEAAKELASIPVDVIVAFGSPPSQAAQAATQTIPIVMVAVGDPVRAGLVASLAHPGRNVTGTSFLGPDVAPKRLQIFETSYPVRGAGSPVVQSKQCLQRNLSRRNRNRSARSRYQPYSGQG